MEQNVSSSQDQRDVPNRRFIKYSVLPVLVSFGLGIIDFFDTNDIRLGIAYIICILIPILAALRLMLVVQASSYRWYKTLFICLLIGITLFFTMLFLVEMIVQCGNGYKCFGLGISMYGGLFYFGFISMVLTVQKLYREK